MRAQRRHREAPIWQRGAGTTGEQPARQHSCLPVHLLALPCRLEAGEGAGTAAAERETNRINPQENRFFLIALKLNTCTPWRAISSPIFHPSPRILHFTFPTRSAILGKLQGLNLSCSAKHNRLVEVTATTEMPAPLVSGRAVGRVSVTHTSSMHFFSLRQFLLVPALSALWL